MGFFDRLNIGFVIWACVLSSLVGCSSMRQRDVNWHAAREEIVWPSPPETGRIEFLREVSPDKIAATSGTGKFFTWLSGEDAAPIPLMAPYAVAADGDGIIWVSDPEAGLVHRYDLPAGTIEYWRSAGPVNFHSPVGLLFAPEENQLYIADAGLRRVFVVSGEGELRGEVKHPDGFRRPVGLGRGPDGKIYITDAKAGTVEVFDAAGDYLGGLGSGLTPGGLFNTPLAVAIDPSGRLFVNDSLNFQIEMLAADGSSVGSFGGVGDTPGSFARPRGVALDSDGHLYVVDAAFGNVQIFDSSGRLLLHFGRWGDGPGEFSLPAGIFIDAHDRIYVADSYNHRVQIFQYFTGAAGK